MMQGAFTDIKHSILKKLIEYYWVTVGDSMIIQKMFIK